MKRSLKIIFLTTLTIHIGLTVVEAAPQRQLFVSVIENKPVLQSRERIDQLIQNAQDAHIQTLFVQIYRANQSWFPSAVGDQTPFIESSQAVGEDPFALLIRQAHAKGIQVHAWLNLLSLAKNSHAPILKKYGASILTRNTERKTSLTDYQIDEQYFLEPGDTRVRSELVQLVSEIAATYPDLDGLQFDYIRYPDLHPVYGYAPENVKRYKRTKHRSTIIDDSPEWKDWKRDQVTELLTLLIHQARAIRPGIHISTTGCMGFTRAYEEAYQDWASWVNSGLIEFVTVMSYPDNVPEFSRNIADAQKRVKDPNKINVGIPAYKLITTPKIFGQQQNMCLSAEVGGCAYFYYGNFVENPELLRMIKQTAASAKP